MRFNRVQSTTFGHSTVLDDLGVDLGVCELIHRNKYGLLVPLNKVAFVLEGGGPGR